MRLLLDVVHRLICKIFGHGPFHVGRLGNEEGKFCQMCDKFFPSSPDKPTPP